MHQQTIIWKYRQTTILSTVKQKYEKNKYNIINNFNNFYGL
jgi:hypothetical protein